MIHGLVKNVGLNSLESMNHYAEQNAVMVARTAPLEFLFEASDNYRSFYNNNEDDRILRVEMNRLLVIVMCRLPSFACTSISVCERWSSFSISSLMGSRVTSKDSTSRYSCTCC